MEKRLLMKLLHTLLLGSLLVLAGCATTSGPDLAGTTDPCPPPPPPTPQNNQRAP